MRCRRRILADPEEGAADRGLRIAHLDRDRVVESAVANLGTGVAANPSALR
jgi:hypothetical protein